jgi:hypothetical protein
MGNSEDSDNLFFLKIKKPKLFPFQNPSSTCKESKSK